MYKSKMIVASLLLILGSALGLLSCGSDFENSGRTAKAGFTPRTVEQQARVCGADKQSGIQGVDVSKYQGTFDWAGVKASDNIKFGYARISDGTGYIDSTFDRNWRVMKEQGILRGGYQYFRPGSSATAQANLVVDKLGRLGPGDLPAMIDVEATGGQSASTIANKIETWMGIVEAGTGKKPIIYTAAYFWNTNVNSSAFSDHPLWVANYGASCPAMPNGWSDWTFWQYCGGGQYCPDGQAYDCDVFNGSQSELEALAGGGADWGASYVDQTFPLAASAVEMVPGQVLSGYIELKNIGGESWNSSTKLAPTEERDRASLFADDTWESPTRVAAVSGNVAPGETYRFEFDMTAPQQLGTYREYFGMIQEGTAWFSDAAQAGPPDDQLQVWIEVVKANYAAEFVGQSFPLASEDTVQMNPGETLDGWIELKNTGKKPWTPAKTRIAPTPRDQASPLEDASWETPMRISGPTEEIAPGESFKFPVTLAATEVGDFTQTFGVVQNGVTWFSDAPKGGGPEDDVLSVHVKVGDMGEQGDAGSDDAGGLGDAGADAGYSRPDISGGRSDIGPLPTDKLGPLLSTSDGRTRAGGCSSAASGSSPMPGGLALLFVVVSAAFARRRR